MRSLGVRREPFGGCCLLRGEYFRRFGIPIPLDLGIGCGPLNVDLLPIGQRQTEAVSLRDSWPSTETSMPRIS